MNINYSQPHIFPLLLLCVSVTSIRLRQSDIAFMNSIDIHSRTIGKGYKSISSSSLNNCYCMSDDSLGRELRSQFPILKQIVHGDKPVIYLDSAATSQKPLFVLDRLERFYKECNSNVHRGAHALSARATDMYF